MRLRIRLLSALLLATSYGQQIQPQPVKVGDVTVTGWLRSRLDVFDWFEEKGTNNYLFSDSFFRLGFTQARSAFDWKVEADIPLLYGLPSGAVAPAPQGQLGLGASYHAANRNSKNTQSIFPKQVYGRFRFGGDGRKQSVLLGRSEFFDGLEVIPQDSTLASLERERIAQRLIGNFGFSDVGRSFDGVVYGLNSARTNVTLMGSRPTRGVFQADGWGELQINLAYGAVTRQLGPKNAPGQLRVFAIGYSDFRNDVLKTDNRPAAVRGADREDINLATVGGNFTQAIQTKAGIFDLLAWGALQGGSWGTQKQRADAYALEGGYQTPPVKHLNPWLRGGYNYGSGDRNPRDGTHGTFFQIMPTARQYARFPFFNLMDLKDAFGELQVKPAKGVTVRADVHSLKLASKQDLWYQGGGAFSPWAFGYIGRPSFGQSGLATLYDISTDYAINPHVTVGLYYAYAAGKLVMREIYPKNPNANYGFGEINYRF